MLNFKHSSPVQQPENVTILTVHSFKTNKQQRKEIKKTTRFNPDFYNAQNAMCIWHLCNANSTTKRKQNTIK